MLIVCCDGLRGFPEAVEATWPQTTVQTCTVHLIRAAMRLVSYTDRKRVAAALRPIYTAPTVEAAETELAAFADSDLGRRYPAAVATWRSAWERFVPFLEFHRAPQDHLHDELHRVPELPAPEDHQEPGPLPQRRRGHQAALAGHPSHRGQARPGPSEGSRTSGQRPPSRRQARRRWRRPRLETSPRRPRSGLPRPHRPLPQLPTHRSTYTDNLTGPGAAASDPGTAASKQVNARPNGAPGNTSCTSTPTVPPMNNAGKIGPPMNPLA